MSKTEKTEGQKKYDRFMDHVKKAYSASLKKEEVFKKGQALWKDVKSDPSKYQKVVNDLMAISARQQQKSISFWAKSSTKKKTPAREQSEVTQEKEKEKTSSTKENNQPPEKLIIVDEESKLTQGRHF